MYSSTENKLIIYFLPNVWMNDVQMILQNEGTGWHSNAANSKFIKIYSDYLVV